MEYFHFSNDLAGISGIVTFACRVNEPHGGLTSVETGFHLSAPGECFDSQVAKEAAHGALADDDIFRTILSANQHSTGKTEDTVRIAWESTREGNSALPDWAKKLDLGMKACCL
jgi:hypothetical protein